MVNDKELGPYDKVSGLQVSATGGAYTYVVSDRNANYRYLNGENLGDFGGMKNFTFSPDGTRYAAELYDKNTFFLDGEKVTYPDFKSLDRFEFDPEYSKPMIFIFSPKGNRLAITYKRATKTNEAVLLLDEEKYISDRNNGGHAFATFSKDGNHFAFLTKVRGEGDKYFWQLFIDMKPGPIVGGMENPYTSPPKNISLRFLDDNSVQTIGVLDKEIVAHVVSF